MRRSGGRFCAEQIRHVVAFLRTLSGPSAAAPVSEISNQLITLSKLDVDERTTAHLVELQALTPIVDALFRIERSSEPLAPALSAGLRTSANVLLHEVMTGKSEISSDPRLPALAVRALEGPVEDTYLMRCALHAIFHYFMHFIKDIGPFVREESGDRAIRSALSRIVSRSTLPGLVGDERDSLATCADFALSILTLCLSLESSTEDQHVVAASPIVEAMTAFPQHSSVQHKGWHCLSLCVSCNSNVVLEVCRALTSRSNLSVLISSMFAVRTFEQEILLREVALMTLSIVMNFGESATAGEDAALHESLMTQLVLSKATETLMTWVCMESLKDNSELVQLYGLCVLVSLSAVDPTLHSDLSLITLRDILKRSANPSVVERVLRIVWNIANRNEAAPKLIEHNVAFAVKNIIAKLHTEDQMTLHKNLTEKLALICKS